MEIICYKVKKLVKKKANINIKKKFKKRKKSVFILLNLLQLFTFAGFHTYIMYLMLGHLIFLEIMEHHSLKKYCLFLGAL